MNAEQAKAMVAVQNMLEKEREQRENQRIPGNARSTRNRSLLGLLVDLLR